ncbi:hypothetical protein CNMCM5793_008878 [Aspergillus hiratsukae]|uniref:Uncharacterized protein n=1 Tax=Aspergillus hiratsukae TaxID=1194566 RepID=A0A8H6P868_9EURO|nr:hypothetical protein CNMCM5793_008878 [Aspergillus hiratsukae]KAF7160763.1 hypothetical protein CNMCM6106_008169 [Aspergillus hiratsukae]
MGATTPTTAAPATMARIIQQQVIIKNGGCYQMEAPKHNNRPRALRQKDKKAIKKKKAQKIDSSIKTLRAEAQELLKAIKEKVKMAKEGKEGNEGKGKTSALVMRSKEMEMDESTPG